MWSGFWCLSVALNNFGEAVLVNRGGDLVGSGFEPGAGIAHGNFVTDSREEVKVIVPVAYANGVRAINAKAAKEIGDSMLFGGV